MNRLIARKILQDTGPAAAFAFPEDTVRAALH
jgi:hypothetical protein